MDLNPECKLFVGGLNKRTILATLQQHFEQWGELVDSVVIKDSVTKHSRGFGFVTYAKMDSVDECLNNGPHVIDDRTVDVKRAVPKPAGQEGDSDLPRSNKVFMGGLPLTITEKEMNDMMKEFGSIDEVVIIKDKNSKAPRGFGFVIFKDLESAGKAIEKKRIKYKDRDIEIKPAQSVNEMKHTGRKRDRMHGEDYDYYDRGGRHDDYYDDGKRSSHFDSYDSYSSKPHNYHSMGGNGGGFMGRDSVYPCYRSEFDNRTYGMKTFGIDSRLGGYSDEYSRYGSSYGSHIGGPGTGPSECNTRAGEYGSGDFGSGSGVYASVYGSAGGYGSTSGEYGSLSGGFGSGSGGFGSSVYGSDIYGSDSGRYGPRSGSFGGMSSEIGPMRNHGVPPNRSITEGRTGPYGGMGIHPLSGNYGAGGHGYHPYKR